MPSRDVLTDTTTAALERSMSGLHTRQNAVADNIANVETPGYKAKRVLFEENLASAIAAERTKGPGSSQARGLVEAVQPRTEDREEAWRRDGNSVNIETEMVEAAKTSAHYKMLARLLAKKFRMLRSAINGGGNQ